MPHFFSVGTSILDHISSRTPERPGPYGGAPTDPTGAVAASSSGFHLVRISPTNDGPYLTASTFNFDWRRIVAIVDDGIVSEVHVGSVVPTPFKEGSTSQPVSRR